MDPLTLLIGSLVTWRVSHMLVKETGPLGIFARFRAHLAQKQQKMGGLFDLISCMACTSVYIGAVTALWVSGGVLEFILYTLSFSAITMLTERLTASKGTNEVK